MAVPSCIHHVEHTPFPKSTKTFIAQSLKIRALQPCMHSRKRNKLRSSFDFVEKFGKFCPENTSESIINSN